MAYRVEKQLGVRTIVCPIYCESSPFLVAAKSEGK